MDTDTSTTMDRLRALTRHIDDHELRYLTITVDESYTEGAGSVVVHVPGSEYPRWIQSARHVGNQQVSNRTTIDHRHKVTIDVEVGYHWVQVLAFLSAESLAGTAVA